MDLLRVAPPAVALTLLAGISVYLAQPSWLPASFKEANEFLEIPLNSTVETLAATGFSCSSSENKVEGTTGDYTRCSTSIKYLDDFGVTVNFRSVHFIGEKMLIIRASGKMEEENERLLNLHQELEDRFSKARTPELWDTTAEETLYEYSGGFLLAAHRNRKEFRYHLYSPLAKSLKR